MPSFCLVVWSCTVMLALRPSSACSARTFCPDQCRPTNDTDWNADDRRPIADFDFRLPAIELVVPEAFAGSPAPALADNRTDQFGAEAQAQLQAAFGTYCVHCNGTLCQLSTWAAQCAGSEPFVALIGQTHRFCGEAFVALVQAATEPDNGRRSQLIAGARQSVAVASTYLQRYGDPIRAHLDSGSAEACVRYWWKLASITHRMAQCVMDAFGAWLRSLLVDGQTTAAGSSAAQCMDQCEAMLESQMAYFARTVHPTAMRVPFVAANWPHDETADPPASAQPAQ